jgi:hypothetical protein
MQVISPGSFKDFGMVITTPVSDQTQRDGASMSEKISENSQVSQTGQTGQVGISTIEDHGEGRRSGAQLSSSREVLNKVVVKISDLIASARGGYLISK